jgi:hypothetical protein
VGVIIGDSRVGDQGKERRWAAVGVITGDSRVGDEGTNARMGGRG